ncbi:MAG: hypothetical protein Q9209_000353 [Squamulea sp. 1 TL-2023]
MPRNSYSSTEFHKDWVYAVGKPFRSLDGTPASWAPGQPQQYGEEHAHIATPSNAEHYSAPAALNADESLIAVGIEHDVYVYTTDTQQPALHQVLKGHVSRVDVLEFHPTDPDVLVSCAMCYSGNPDEAPPTIIFWSLKEQRQRGQLTQDQTAQLGNYAAQAVVNRLNDPNQKLSSTWTITQDKLEALGQDFSKAIEAQHFTSQTRRNVSLHGRLAPSFGSQIFNCNGKSMAFEPGDSPRSNGDDKFNICIYDTTAHSVRLTLVGHRDAIMWIGFSPNDEFIASVSWDETFRIWSHATGELLYTFRSTHENWTGAFSKDSRFFAATSGEGRLWVWDLVHGIEVLSYAFSDSRSHEWCRALDWSPDGSELALGAGHLGRIMVLNIKRQELVQNRVLSTQKLPKDVQHRAGSFMEVHTIRYLSEKAFGRKLLSRTTGDNAVEVYDMDENRLWRFAPSEGNEEWCGSTLVLERQGLIVSVDKEAIRFWRLPKMGEVE